MPGNARAGEDSRTTPATGGPDYEDREMEQDADQENVRPPVLQQSTSPSRPSSSSGRAAPPTTTVNGSEPPNVRRSRRSTLSESAIASPSTSIFAHLAEAARPMRRDPQATRETTPPPSQNLLHGFPWSRNEHSTADVFGSRAREGNVEEDGSSNTERHSKRRRLLDPSDQDSVD